MKISVIQPDIVWENKARNFQNLNKFLLPLFGNTDLVILPEMFNTGFSMKPAELSEYPEEETFIWMKSMAEKGNLGICGSYIVRDGMHFFNRWVFVSKDQETCYYDKRHLFSMGGEDKIFSPGKTRLSFIFKGFRINPYICYDLRFPVWSRSRGECDLIIFSANWPFVRKNVWNTLLKARAIENQCYVAGSNRTGTDGEGIKYSGESMIVNPKGELLAVAASDVESTISADLSLSELSDFRNKFPVMNDADDFTLIL